MDIFWKYTIWDVFSILQTASVWCLKWWLFTRFQRISLAFPFISAQGYKISLQISLTHETLIFQHKKRNFVSPSGHVMFYLFCKHHWNAKPLTFLFGAKGMIYNVTIATMIFSHLKITVTLFGWQDIQKIQILWLVFLILFLKLVHPHLVIVI